MLILIRRIGEAIYIDKGRIKVHLISENEGLIRLGIEAPKHVDIERKEVFVRKAVTQHEQAQTLRKKSGGEDA
ncbi:TPA: carbon storage regulator [Legionella pneumophila]|nr:carbon storage regulator [Legionella pneumophila]MDW9166286.1 carbon storage regulator [Legionella pneumophila subsp. fraseri]MDX1845040.1 carbon storage regulator [Legionella pneumophila subsp. fraseri]HAT1770909.1 carbon storage regulator [Legionella pneumophila]HAT2125782.1 carbon storage regulator [Legionella pneumophila]HAT2134818.1 carbon storage regulator [Legionella pneumophila]